MVALEFESSYNAFWSYVRKDNKNDHGRILQLADDIAAEYELISGDELNIFRDVQDIAWGEDWREKISQTIAGIAFLIPVYTPSYFKSQPCREELQEFIDSAEKLGLTELLLPIFYLNVPELLQDSPDDPLMQTAKKYNWVDWRDMRLSDPSSSEYRTAVNDLAQRLVAVNRQAETSQSNQGFPTEPAAESGKTEDEGDDDDGDDLGSLDKIGITESALPQLTEKIEILSALMETLSAAIEPVGAQIEEANSSPRPMASRLTILKRLSMELQPIADDILTTGKDFSNTLIEMDPGLRELIVQSREESGKDPETAASAGEFASQIDQLANSSEEGLTALKNLADSIQPVENLSKDLRRPLRDMRRGLMIAYDGLAVILRWQQLLNS